MLEELTQDNLDQVIAENDKVIVQYGASWCGVCRMIKPQFTRLAEETDGVKFLYVDAEKFPNSRQLAEVNNLPTFAGFSGGTLVKQGMGNNKDVIQGIIDEVTSH